MVHVSTPAKMSNSASARQQVLARSVRLSTISYFGVFWPVGFCWYQGAFPLRVLLEYGAMVAVIIAVSYINFRTRINLRFRDSDLTMFQTIIAFLPTLWVMYWTDSFPTRAALLMVSTLPALYGVIALNTRRLLLLAAFYVGAYLLLLTAVWLREPRLINVGAEAILLLAFAMVMVQSAAVGGFISGLRLLLRQRNAELRSTMAELNAAVAEISELANRDALTSMFNRRHVFSVLQGEIARCERAETDMPLTLCMFDIDHFKNVNDTHGHQAGDEVLCLVATAVEQVLREIDTCARYGGEEFLLVLPHTPLSGAQVVAERVRRRVEELRFPEVGSEFRVTISIGVTQYARGESIESAIARADAALYTAKSDGRNRVEAA